MGLLCVYQSKFFLRIILWDQFFPGEVMRFYRIRDHNLAPRKNTATPGCGSLQAKPGHSQPDIKKKHRYGTKSKGEADKVLKPTQSKKRTILGKALSLRHFSNR